MAAPDVRVPKSCSLLAALAILCASVADVTFLRTTPPVAAATAPGVAAGGSHSCALIDDGTIKCWGENGSGQLGNGTNIDSTQPVTVGGPVGAGQVLEIPVAGRYGIPTNAPAAVLNATIVGPQADGFATIYPCGNIPEASSLNYRTSQDIPNELIAKLSPTGTICIYTYATTNLIIDAVGHVS